MGDLNNLIGVTISSMDASLKEKLEEAKAMHLGWIQVYVGPRTRVDNLKSLVDSGLEIAVHAAHEGDNFLFGKPCLL